MDRRNLSNLPLPGEGPVARAADRDAPRARPHAARPTGSTPSRTAPPASIRPHRPIFRRSTFPDADAQRTARRACDTHFDDATHVLTVRPNGREAARGDLRTAAGRAAIEALLRRLLRGRAARAAEDAAGAPATAFPTWPHKVVSIINLASVAAVETAVGAPVDPLRFRGNLYVERLAGLGRVRPGRRKSSRSARRALKVVKRIVRCAATNVEPGTGIRDMKIPQTLMQAFGHMDCGIYAEVVGGGTIRSGDAVTRA